MSKQVLITDEAADILQVSPEKHPGKPIPSPTRYRAWPYKYKPGPELSAVFKPYINEAENTRPDSPWVNSHDGYTATPLRWNKGRWWS
jgi:hypothetical protein